MPGDEHEVAEVHVRSWQAAYRGLLPDAYLDALRPGDRARRYTFSGADPGAPETVVAVDGEVICGFATIGEPRSGEAAGTGELFAIYVHPAWWGRGAGRSLIQDARRRLVSHGASNGVLWVLAGNLRAQRFYRLDGWTETGTRRQDDVHGIVVDEVQFGRGLP